MTTPIPFPETPARAALVASLRTLLPQLSPTDTATGTIRGGRPAALAALQAIHPRNYARTRNFLDGDVTHLSPYLRHGVLSLAEVRDHALSVTPKPDDASKLIQELAWRDYWQRLYVRLGDDIWRDQEEPKTGFAPGSYSDTLPPELGPSPDDAAGTDLACMAAFAEQLVTTGYLHNHARMWMAAWLIHWRRVRWQAGARWFLSHLLDGDPASNNLSWQWVASTFSVKPYIFNRENLSRYTGNRYCASCPAAAAHTCPFDHSYEALTETLFPQLHSGEPFQHSYSQPVPLQKPTQSTPSAAPPKDLANPLLWIHTDILNPELPVFRHHPGRPAVFVWDTDWLTEEAITLKRAVFLAECLESLPKSLVIHAGDPATHLLAEARATGSTYILAQRTPDPRLLRAAATLSRHLPVVWFDPAPFLHPAIKPDLKRFSRYWQKAQHSASLPTHQPA